MTMRRLLIGLGLAMSLARCASLGQSPMHVHEFNFNEVGNQIFTVGHEKSVRLDLQVCRPLGQAQSTWPSS